MTATDLERKNISTVILAVFLGFSLSFRFLGINHPIMSYFSAFILCTVPGFLLIEVFNVDFEMHEIIPFSVILSLGFITILGSWLTVLPSHFNLIGFYTVIFILLLIRHKSKCHNKIQAPIILLKKEIFTILVSLLILSIPILFLGTILDDKYFLGYDPFLNEPLVSKIIHEKMQTIEILTDESIVFSGFFIFLGALQYLTGISIYWVTRFGGLICLALLQFLLFGILFKNQRSLTYSLVPFLYVLNPFIINRFLMTIRENYALVFFLALIYFLIRLTETGDSKRFIPIASLMFGVIFVSHPLVLTFSFLMIGFFMINSRRLELFGLIGFGVLLAIPLMPAFIPWSIWMSKTVVARLIGAEIIVPFWLSSVDVGSGWQREMLVRDFNLLLFFLLPFGVYDVIKNRTLSKDNITWLVSILFTSSAIFFGQKLGLNFTLARLEVYLCLPLAIFSFYGLRYLISKVPGHSSMNLNVDFKELSVSTRVDMKVILVFFTIIWLNIPSLALYSKSSPYNENQVDGAADFCNYISQTEKYVILSPREDMTLLKFVGYETERSDREDIIEILESMNRDEALILINQHFPDVEHIFVFLRENKIDSYHDRYFLTYYFVNEKPYFEKSEVVVYKIDWSVST